MLDKIILEKSESISYSQAELSNISSSSNHLREIVKNQNDFGQSFLGGSYKRCTMVKGISDVDVYFEYTGTGDSRNALARLRTCLVTSYPTTDIKKDTPSILVDFNKIPFNVTPYKSTIWSQNISIPIVQSGGWETTRIGELEVAIPALRSENSKYIDLIKILKLWNFNHNKGLKNFEIEWRVLNIFLYPYISSTSISDWMWTFFQNQGFTADANKFKNLMINTTYSEATLKTEWLKFINNN
jgi:hypothetical protein